MIDLFRRKRKRIIDHLQVIEKKKPTFFQLDIIRNNQVELQLFPRKILDSFGIPKKSEKGYVVLITFNEQKTNGSQELRDKFLLLFSDNEVHAVKGGVGDTYVVLCSQNINEVCSLVQQILEKVYGYNKKTKFDIIYRSNP